jgi:serine/threonine protein kinase
VKDFPEFVYRKNGAQSIWIDRLLVETELLALLNSPDDLLEKAGCEIIKDQKKIKIGRLSVTLEDRRRTIYIKRYNAFSWRYRLGSLFMRSGALDALRGGEILKKADISIARPLAAVESRRYGSLDRSFFVSEEIDRGKTVDAYWLKELAQMPGREGYRTRRNFLLALAGLLSRLHRQRIYHNDLKDSNIVVRPTDRNDHTFFLLDLEGLRRCWYVSGRRRIKNLVQLHRTLGTILSRTHKLYFLDAYLGPHGAACRNKRRWIRRILNATEKADQRFFHKMRRRTATAI